jgi:hypothetical protein
VALVMAFSALFVTLRYIPNPRVETVPVTKHVVPELADGEAETTASVGR